MAPFEYPDKKMRLSSAPSACDRDVMRCSRYETSSAVGGMQAGRIEVGLQKLTRHAYSMGLARYRGT
jgi:hypothetical protein